MTEEKNIFGNTTTDKPPRGYNPKYKSATSIRMGARATGASPKEVVDAISDYNQGVMRDAARDNDRKKQIAKEYKGVTGGKHHSLQYK